MTVSADRIGRRNTVLSEWSGKNRFLTNLHAVDEVISVYTLYVTY